MSQNLYVEVLTQVPHNVTVFGDQAFKVVIRLLGWTLIHYDLCPYEKKFGDTEIPGLCDAQRDDHVRTQ